MSSTPLQTDEALLAEIYTELKRLASRKLSTEPSGLSLGATDLVHEAFLRLKGARVTIDWASESHYFMAVSEAMRRILVDRARRRKALKRNNGRTQALPDDFADPSVADHVDLIALDDALQKLEEGSPRQAAVVKLRYFAGLTNAAAAAVLGVSRSTVDSDWVYARAKLRAALGATTSR